MPVRQTVSEVTLGRPTRPEPLLPGDLVGVLDRLELLAVQRYDERRLLERHGQRGPRLGHEALEDLRVGRLAILVEEALQNVGAGLDREDAVLDDVLEEAQPAVLLDVEVEP